MANDFPYKSILITGASSGLGRALAIFYAQKEVTLFLSGRNKKRLEETKKKCIKLGATVHIKVIDVTDKIKMSKWVHDSFNIEPLDLVIANAGISAGTAGQNESREQFDKVVDINLNGVTNTIFPAIELMQISKHGQIAIISSMAAYRGLPSAPAYSTSKAAVKVMGESLRGNLAKDNVKVNVITPGYIKTAMTDANDFPMPFIMSAEKACQIIDKGLQKNKSRIAFPFIMYSIMWIVNLMPQIIIDPIFSRLPGKKPLEK